MINNVHLLFLLLTTFAAVVMPISVLIIAPIWIGFAYVQDRVTSENRN